VVVIVLMGISFQLGRQTAPSTFEVNCKEEVVKNEVKTAVSLLSAMNDKYLEGEIGLVQAKTIGKDLVENLNYGDRGEGRFVVEDTKKSTVSGVFKAEFAPFGWVVWSKPGVF